MTKLPMAYAAQVLSQICDEIDGTERIDGFLKEAFEDARLSLSDAVDRRIAFDRWTKIQKDAAEEAIDFYKGRLEILKSVHEKFKQRTKEILEATPDVPYVGKLGPIKIAGNGGQRTITYAFGDKRIDPDTAALFGVPADYVIAKTIYAIDTERVRAELEAGRELEWATLEERGTHIQFPRTPKQKAIEGTKE